MQEGKGQTAESFQKHFGTNTSQDVIGTHPNQFVINANKCLQLHDLPWLLWNFSVNSSTIHVAIPPYKIKLCINMLKPVASGTSCQKYT